MILDPIFLHNRNEYFAYSGTLKGKYYRQRGNKVEIGTYDGEYAQFITDADFFKESEIEFPNEKQAQEYVYNLVT